MFIVLLLLALPPLLYFAAHHTQSSKELGFVNTTVIIGTYSSFWYSKLSVSECLQSRDYSHVNRIALVHKNYEIVRVTDFRLKRNLFYQEYSSSTTGLIDYLYLLKGSSIKHNLCLASTSDSNTKGTIFIFDDELKYRQYAVNPNAGPELSVYSRSLEIGANNKTTCTAISFDVNETAYYFIAARTPAGIIYSYETLVHELYLNKDDFNFSNCIASEPAVCNLPLSGNLFAAEEYDLVAYIEPSIAADPLTTHLCAESHISPEVVALVGVLGGVVGISVLGIVSITCISLIHCHRRRNRRGYIKITDIQGS